VPGEAAVAAPNAAPPATRPNASNRFAAPRIRAKSAIVVDLDDGSVLFARRADQRRPIASITKVMTALIVLERNPQLSGTATVSRRAARQVPTKIGLRRGERISVSDLMYGLLLWSGNDAAVALAEHMAGSVPAFLRLMNAKADALGLEHTYFASPSGLDDRGVSTARDVAVLARTALANQRFADLVHTRRHRIHGPRTQLHRLRNLNRLLGTYPGALGVKTGYTRASGECVVGAARIHGRSVLAVVMGEPLTPRWRRAYSDTTKLLDYGFARLALPHPVRLAHPA
jgi:D-alanyl-D-alanine carboxypeptidase